MIRQHLPNYELLFTKQFLLQLRRAFYGFEMPKSLFFYGCKNDDEEKYFLKPFMNEFLAHFYYTFISQKFRFMALIFTKPIFLILHALFCTIFYFVVKPTMFYYCYKRSN
jgi:hypothetical protein